VIRNLLSWAGEIHTDVLCVVDQSNVPAAYELIDTLADYGLAEKKVRMRFSPVSPTYDNQTIEEVTQNFADNPELLKTELKIIDAITKLQIYAAKRGLIDELRPQGTWCAVIRANGQNVAITPDGKVYSCPVFIGRDAKYETGHISKEARGGLDALMETFSFPDECKKCTYLPICSNCRADALTKTGDVLGANSHKERYDLILPQLIKAHYDRLPPHEK
jgi:radical SAM protein with 4Fe4S-binding SPASM domain